MKKYVFMTTFMVIMSALMPLEADIIYKYQIISDDASALNSLSDNITGLSGKPGWPVPTDEVEISFVGKTYGISYIKTETTSRKEGLDSIVVSKYRVTEVNLSGSDFSGSLSSIKLEKCTLFYITNTKITGSVPNLDLPECKIINLSGNMFTGTIPDLKLNYLEELYLVGNKLTGSLSDFDLPGLKRLDISHNKLTGKIINFTKMTSLENLDITYNLFTSIESEYKHPRLKNIVYYTSDTVNLKGELPSLDCPSLEEFNLGNNKLTGSIPNYNLPNCKSIVLLYNNLTGELPNFNLPQLETLDLASNNLTGEVPSLNNCTNLKYLNLFGNEFTSLNQALNPPNLEFMNIADNKLTGSIPPFNMPNLKTMDLGYNNLTGILPAFNLPSLEKFDLSLNKITGDIPDYNMPKLRLFEMEFNRLSGRISNFNSPELEKILLKYNLYIKGPLPALNLPKLKELDISMSEIQGSLPVMILPQVEIINLMRNQMTDSLPTLNYPKVKYFYLDDNNFTGKIPTLILPEVLEFSLSVNKLTGKIPSLNIPKVTVLGLSNNMFEGGFDFGTYPALRSLSISSNRIDSIPNLLARYPNLNSLSVQNNKLEFNHIELNLGVKNLYYSPQDSIDHYKKSIGVLTKFYVLTGGSQNKYQWRKKNGEVWTDVPNATESSFTTTYKKGDIYGCKVTNTLAPKLTLYSKLAEEPSCITLGVFDICNESGEWNDGEKNELVATGKVKINDFLNFEGAFTVDTTKLSVKANGKFYLTEIPLPGGSQIGRYDLAEGEYELSLLGDSGVITNFANAKIKEYAKLAGVNLQIEKLKLLGGRSANGIGLDLKIGIPGIAGKCDEESGEDAEATITLSGLEISTSGFAMEGVSIENMAMFIKNFCIKKLEASYEKEENAITAAADIQLPFGQVAGGFKLIDGLIDSIGWRLEATKPPFVLGTTTIGIKGFFGHISSITQPAIEVELGGIFGDILSDDLYTVDASGRTIWPTLFEVKGDGKFMRPPKLGLPYQLNSTVTMAYDHPLSQFKVGFDGKIGTSDEKTWLMTAQGEFKISAKTSPPKFAGSLSGEMSLPKFGNGFPYSWLESIAPFPLKGSTNATFVWGYSHLLHGDVSFKLKTFGTFKLKYVANLAKQFGSEDFLWFETDVSLTSKSLRSASDLVSQEVDIPSNTEFAVIRISGQEKMPVSNLVTPSGKSLSNTSETDNIVKSSSTGGKETYWTLINPAAGKWNIEIQDKLSGDSVFVYLKKAAADFNISMVQTGNRVTVTWDKSLFGPDYSIYLMLDDDNLNFDGFSIAQGLANTGSLSFDLTDQLSSCSYYLFAQVQGTRETFSKYATEKLVNTKSILTPPLDITANYDSYTGMTKVRYTDNYDFNTIGYIITVRDSLGKDSVYAVVNRRNGSIDIDIKDVANSTFYLTCYGENGLQGCPSEPNLISGVFNPKIDNEESVNIYPNPSKGIATIFYNLKNDGRFEIYITDLLGRIVSRPLSGIAEFGKHEFQWDSNNLQDGIYLVVLKTNKEIKTTKCILRKN